MPKHPNRYQWLVRTVNQLPPNNDCVLWPFANNGRGYGLVWIPGQSYKEPRALVHRVAYELAYGKIPDGMFACHRCDTKNCLRPSHLFLGTNADNIKDYLQKGGRIGKPQSGESNPYVQLSAEDVLEMRRLCSEGVTYKDLAKRFGIAHGTVSGIIRATCWKHLGIQDLGPQPHPPSTWIHRKRDTKGHFISD